MTEELDWGQQSDWAHVLGGSDDTGPPPHPMWRRGRGHHHWQHRRRARFGLRRGWETTSGLPAHSSFLRELGNRYLRRIYGKVRRGEQIKANHRCPGPILGMIGNIVVKLVVARERGRYRDLHHSTRGNIYFSPWRDEDGEGGASYDEWESINQRSNQWLYWRGWLRPVAPDRVEPVAGMIAELSEMDRLAHEGAKLRSSDEALGIK